MNLNTQKSVVVIGGGVIGAASAWYLARSGWRVTLLDQGKVGSGASHGNCGLISPSHVLPLTVPGAVRQSISWMLQPDAPLYVKPRLDPAFWQWGYAFAKQCHEQPMLLAAEARHNLLQLSLSCYEALFANGTLACRWEQAGATFVFRSPKALEDYRLSHDHLDTFGVRVNWLSRDDLLKQEPALCSDVVGGVTYKQDAHLEPDALMRSWVNALEAEGVEIRENCEAKAWSRNESTALSLETNQGHLAADQFVVACGAWTGRLAELSGVQLPIQPGKGYSITTNRPTPSLSMPCLFYEARMFATPWKDRFRLGGTMEFSGYDDTLNSVRIGALRRRASEYLRVPLGNKLELEWCGWRPMTSDGVPVIGRSPNLRNV